MQGAGRSRCSEGCGMKGGGGGERERERTTKILDCRMSGKVKECYLV